MRWTRQLRLRLRSLLRRSEVEQELDEEFRYHLDHLVDEFAASGMTPKDARQAALREMGGIEQQKEECRDVRRTRLIEDLVRDLRFAIRVLARSPGFTAAVAISLALGIGANTAIFTLMDAVMWRLLPIRDAEGLLVVGRLQDGAVQPGFSYSQYRFLRDGNTVANLAGYTTAPISVSVDGSPEPGVQGQLVTGEYFSLLGVTPVLGRAIAPEDDRVPGGHPLVMLSHGYWERRFARDPSVIGRTIRLSSVPFTIIGIAPAGFFGVEIGTAPDLFLPIAMQPVVMPAFENLLENPINNRSWVHAIARTKPGVERGQAAAALDALFQTHPDNRLPPGVPQSRRGHVGLVPARDVSPLRRQFSQPLVVLLAMVGVVLLTACANTANLLLARGMARRPEVAMRLALGAGRPRLLRQLLVESLVLAAIGGACGVLLAQWATRLLVAFMSSGRTPIVLDLTPNGRILAFTAAVSTATGLLFGLAPAWRATRVDLSVALKNIRTSSGWRIRPGRLLAIAQLALSLFLLVAAGIFVRSLQHLNGDDLDGLRQSVVMLRVEPRGSDQRNIPGTSERLDRIYRELIRRAQELPDVRVASMAQVTPTASTPNAASLVRMPSGDDVRIPTVMIYPSYFATIGIPVVRGRDFFPADLSEQAPGVCIVNESFVRQVFEGADPIGKPCAMDRRPFAIVGVVQDSRYSNPSGGVRPVIYKTFLQTSTGRGQMVLHVRVAGSPAAAVQRIREQVVAVDPTIPMFDVHTLEEEMNAALVQHRLIALLSSLFGALALLLACVGLYGLLAFTVAQRMGEMGIRMALGARGGDVAWLVVGEALVLVAIGIAAGVPASLAAARLASSQITGLLFGIEATDPATIAGAACALTLVAGCAAYLPARRASRVDPMVVLRTE
jgi:predicted permease